MIIKIGIFSAIAFLIMYLEFPLLASFAFLQFDFSDVITLIGGITLGPIAAVAIALIKNILHFILKSQTGGVGELANFITALSYVLPTVLVYRKLEGTKGLLLGMAAGAVTMVLATSLFNFFLFLPLWGITGTADKLNTIKLGLLPFNALKAVIQSAAGVIIFNGMKGIFKFIKN